MCLECVMDWIGSMIEMGQGLLEVLISDFKVRVNKMLVGAAV